MRREAGLALAREERVEPGVATGAALGMSATIGKTVDPPVAVALTKKNYNVHLLKAEGLRCGAPARCPKIVNRRVVKVMGMTPKPMGMTAHMKGGSVSIVDDRGLQVHPAMTGVAVRWQAARIIQRRRSLHR